ncbi:hypothetical protein HDU93_005392, partial [Gonapodya sp. JEL0774]
QQVNKSGSAKVILRLELDTAAGFDKATDLLFTGPRALEDRDVVKDILSPILLNRARESSVGAQSPPSLSKRPREESDNGTNE